MQTIEDLGVDLISLTLAVGFMFAFLWLGILLHELGHAVVTFLVGGRVLAGRVGASPQVWPVWLFVTVA